jgi:glycosyltransferase involved in cell wall biosynthesis
MKPIHIVQIGASLEQNGGIATVENLILKYTPDDVRVTHITSHDEGSILHRIKVFTKCVFQLLGQLILKPTDVIHIHVSDRGSLIRKSIVALIGFSFGKPVVMHTHGGPFPVTYAGLPKAAQKFLNWLFGKCSGFIVLSQGWKDFYVQTCHLNPQKVWVLINPTEIPATIPDRVDREGVVTLFYCGRISQQKGAFDMIRAFAQLPPQNLNSAHLIIAGDVGIEEGKQLVESLNLTTSVSFPGWVNADDREKLLAKSDIFLLPSYHEGMPMGVLEAMSWGLPVITTPVGGIPEVISDRENGLLINPGDIDALSEAMKDTIADRNLRLSLGQNARKSVQKFDIKNYWHNLSKIFLSVMSKARQELKYERQL